MTIPEYSILFLAIVGAGLSAVRLQMAFFLAGNPTGKRGTWEIGASRTIGTREIQEDEYGITEKRDGVMAVLADGMGTRYGGKIASRTAVQVFLDLFEDQNAFYNPQYYFRKAFQGANREILNQLSENQGRASVAAVMIRERRLYYATVGNVKVAVYRNHELVPVTSGHTVGMLAKQKYTEGKLTRQDAVALLDHQRLYNYVGQDGFRDVEFFDTPITLYGGELVVLMTDGLYDAVGWKALEDGLEQEGTSQEKAFGLVELVNQSGEEEKDNGAVVVIRVW